MIKNQYSGMMTVLYDRVLRHRVIPLNRTDTIWNINFNTPAGKEHEGDIVAIQEVRRHVFL